MCKQRNCPYSPHLCQDLPLGKKLVVHREITVSVKLIRHSTFLWKTSFFLFFFFFLRSKMILLFGLAGKTKKYSPEINSFQ